MPHIRLIEEDDAEGLLKEEYDAAVERAGKVFNILKAMSLRPGVLRASMALWLAEGGGNPALLGVRERDRLDLGDS